MKITMSGKFLPVQDVLSDSPIVSRLHTGREIRLDWYRREFIRPGAQGAGSLGLIEATGGLNAQPAKPEARKNPPPQRRHPIDG